MADIGTLNSLYGSYRGLKQGGAVGDTRAAIGAGKAASSLGAFGSNTSGVNQGLGAAGSALGLYQGLKTGGVSGYGQAAISAANLAGIGTGPAGAILSTYNTAKNWKSGATGADAMNGAVTGAEWGSAFGPVGTAVGAVVGGAVGAIASAFGPGAKDPETVGVQKLLDAVGKTPQQASQLTSAVQNPYIAMAGLFDRHESTLPMYQQYGRMGEQKFTNDMISKVKAAQAQGMKNPAQIYNQVIAPWVAGMGKGWNGVGQTYQATAQGLLQNMTAQIASGSYQQNFRAIGGDAPFAAPATGQLTPLNSMTRNPYVKKQ